MRERLIELIAESALKGDYTYIPDVADYLLANGVIVLPCKVGDTVYMIDDYDCEPYVLAVKIDHIKIDKISVWVGLRYPLGIKHTPLVPVDDIGKTIFLTREEAEKALKGGEGDG